MLKTVGEKVHICGCGVWLDVPGPVTGCEGIIQKALAGTIMFMAVFPTAQTGTRPCGTEGVAGWTGARVDDSETASVMSTNSLLEGRFRFFVVRVVVVEVVVSRFVVVVVVGILRVPPTETAMAGTVPVPVASMMDCSACSRSHRTVSPSDLWPSSRVSWKIRAAQVAGIRILRPRPSTFVWRSLVEERLMVETDIGVGMGTDIGIATGTIPIG